MTYPHLKPVSLVKSRLIGSAFDRFLRELFGNSAWFPIANTMFEILLEEAGVYLRGPDLYSIFFACFLQAYFLSRWQAGDRPRRFWGNLIGPAVYTLIEVPLEGMGFFSGLNHVAYWGFALAIGILQSMGGRSTGVGNALIVILENLVRASILLAMYAIFENAIHPDKYFDAASFLADNSHQFISLAIPLLGVILGLSELVAQQYLNLLRRTSARLTTYSEWLLGRDLLNRLIVDPEALSLIRKERAVLFMDVRAFTPWSESHTPEEVVNMLNGFYLVSEEVLTQYGARKFKFNADEAMAVFMNVKRAVSAATALRTQMQAYLAEHGLGAGIGLHIGLLVEGLLGGREVRFYDVIGDTVNAAKRIESAARAGEILLSEAARLAAGDDVRLGAGREIIVKGIQDSIIVYPVLDQEKRVEELF